MRYNYRTGVSKKRSSKWLIVPVIVLLAGGYLLFNALAPQILPQFTANADATAKVLVSTQPNYKENRLYIPQINVDVLVVEINGDETKALEKGAVHRAPESGNPKDGGNFVLAAHRFQLGYTPQQTMIKSPFYHLDQLKTGDRLYVDYSGTRYAYEVTERKLVPPTAVEIEQRTDSPQLTLYSCELSGPKAGREVVLAKPIGTIAWINGSPKLQTITN